MNFSARHFLRHHCRAVASSTQANRSIPSRWRISNRNSWKMQSPEELSFPMPCSP